MAINVRKTKFSLLKSFFTLFLAAIIVIAIGFFVVTKDVNGVDINESVTIDVPEGAGSSVVADILSENNIIKYPTVFRIYSRLGNYDGKYTPGKITIHNQMSYEDILETLIASDRNTIKVTIPEGYTAKQIAETMSDAGLCSESDFMSALDPSLYEYKFLNGLPERDMSLEGYLFPATYEFTPDATPKEIVTAMLDAFSEAFRPEYYDRAKDINMTIDEIVTLASIIERETSANTERNKVAGVFYNRINAGQRLESCATVQYILGENKPVLSIEDTQINSPYNTYKNPGLPIGPICSPGAECIKAALYPEKTDAFYFCLGKDGKHIFSVTYEEHMKAMKENGL